MADFENMQNFNNYQINLEDNIELRKAIAKLEDLLSKKHLEIENITKLYQDFKLINEKNRKEVQELSSKLSQAYSEKSNSEKKYEAEIQKLKNYYERQKEIYEQQIAKLSYQDSESVKNKLAIEIDLKYQNILKEKELELDNLNDQIFEWKKKNELLATEYETCKGELNREIDQIKVNYCSEVKDLNFKIQLLNEKSELNNDKESIRELKSDLEITRKNVSDFQNEIANLRKEKETLTKEKFESNLNMSKELEKSKLDLAIKNTDYERVCNSFKLIETENSNLRNKFDSKNDEIKNLIEEKLHLVQSNFSKENQIENFKAENALYKKRLDEREQEYNKLEKISMEKDKNHFLKEKKDREEFQNKNDELNNRLREMQIDYRNSQEKSKSEIETLKKDVAQLIDEKKFFISKFGEVDKNQPNPDCSNTNNINDKNLQNVVAELNLQILGKNKLIEKLKANIMLYKKVTGLDLEENIDVEDYNNKNENTLNQIIKELREKIKTTNEKKNYYKSKCKIANEKLKFVVDKFNQAEKQEANNQSKMELAQLKSPNVEEIKKDKDPNEDVYNDFEENISIGSNNWQ